MFTAGDKLEYGHYTVLRELGAGGMGVVYHCRDEFLQREIAIKMLLPELMADDDTVEVFRQEARLAAQLEHPNVVTIHNIGLENREGKVHHYIAMEFLPGGSLKQRITGEHFSMEQCLEWMKQLAIGLNYAHKRGVVHQDIKPDNIFITQDGNLKIGDFGLALIATGVAVERAVQGKGTPAYMSPELCQGDPQDHRSDIYSLGTVFYELVTRERPYKASGMIEMAMKHATAPIPSARKINPDVPDVLDRAIQKMMAKSPDERYQSLSDVLAILEKLLLEVQVARLGVGTSKPIETKKERAEKKEEKAEKAPAATPNVTEAEDFANFLKNETMGGGAEEKKAKPEPVKAEAPKAAPPADDMDGLDDLLDTLLTEKDIADSMLDDEPAPESKAVTAETKKPEAAEKPPEAKPAAAFDEDVTGEIDAVFQSVIRAEAAQLAQATQAERDASEVGKTIAGPAAPKDTGSPRQSRTGIPAVGKMQQLDVAWQFKTAGPIGWASMPVSSRDRKVIYIGSSDGYLYALDAAKGNTMWQYDTGAAVVASPVFGKEKIIVASSNGSLHALSPNGQKLWEYTSTSPLVATPLVRNDDLLLSSMDGTLKFLNGNDGTVKWTYRTDGPVVSTPEVLENLVFVSSKDKCVHAVSLDKGWRQWVFQSQAPIVAGPLCSTDSVYVGSTDGNFYALEAETGKQIWKYATDKPIVSKGTLEFTSLTVCSEDKWIHCIEKYRGELVWKSKVQSPVMSNLVSTGGSLYVANREGWLQCFNLKNGELKWQMDCEKRLESAPLIAGKMIYQGMVSGDVVAYNLPN
jgi:serine/threonine protein kinase/outer membrane protein assembly factor BamB